MQKMECSTRLHLNEKSFMDLFIECLLCKVLKRCPMEDQSMIKSGAMCLSFLSNIHLLAFFNLIILKKNA